MENDYTGNELDESLVPIVEKVRKYTKRFKFIWKGSEVDEKQAQRLMNNQCITKIVKCALDRIGTRKRETKNEKQMNKWNKSKKLKNMKDIIIMKVIFNILFICTLFSFL